MVAAPSCTQFTSRCHTVYWSSHGTLAEVTWPGTGSNELIRHQSWTLQDQARITAVAKSSKPERLACLEASFGAYVDMLRTNAHLVQVGRQRPGAGYHQCGISAGYQ